MKTPRTKKPKATVTYLIEDMPADLWQRARVRALTDGIKMYQVLEGLLRAYVAGKAVPKI